MFRTRTVRAGSLAVAVLATSLGVVVAAEATGVETCQNATTVGRSDDGMVVRTPYADDDTEATLQTAYEDVRRPNDAQWHYLTYVPESAVGRGAVPLVMTMHGLLGAAGQHVPQTQWQQTADEHGFVLIAPNGHRAWDYTNGSVDTAYLRDVVADAVGHNCIDTRRIYSTGHSMGGFMTHRVTCDLGDVFAAGASYAAGDLRNGGPCTPGLDDDGDPIPGWERMSLGNWHGTADSVVGYGAGRRGMAKWLDAYECDTTPVRTTPRLGDGTPYGDAETWTNCLDGVDLHFRTMPAHGHAWPDGCGGQNSGTGGNLDCEPEPGTGPWPVASDLSNELWAFLSQHARSTPAVGLTAGASPRLHQRPQPPTNVAGDGIESGVDSFGSFSRSAVESDGTALTTNLTLRFEYTGDGTGSGGIHPLCPTSGPGAGTQAYDGRQISVSAVDRSGEVVETVAVGSKVVRDDGDHEEDYAVSIPGDFDAANTVLRAHAEAGVTKVWWLCGTPAVSYKETIGEPNTAS